MKKLSIILSMTLLLATVFSGNNALCATAETQKIGEQGGVYSYDIDTGVITYTPDSIEISTKSNRSSQQNTPAYVPEGLSIDPPSDIQPYTIFNENWQEINPATGGQYRNTVYLDITTTNGSYRGTGFMIGPNTVATCGHCLYDTDYGSNPWAQSIEVIPAMANDSYPYGSAYAKGLTVSGNWSQKGDAKYDWGIIRLRTNIGDNVGWLGLRWQSNSYNGTNVNVNGYPGQVGGRDKYTMYRANGSVTSSYTKMLYSTNINNIGGMSGGPMYIYSSQYGYQAIAFTRGENPNFNVYIRIDEGLFEKFSSFRDQRA